MRNSALVIGSPGSGKSTSLRNLDPATTFIINVIDKPLPFRGFKKDYKSFTKDNPKGNYYATDNWENIIKCMHKINKERPEIKTLIIDDFQYVMFHEFMRRIGEKNQYEKYNHIALHAWSIVNEANKCRSDLITFFFSHSDTDATGYSKCKTLGKLLEDKLTLEGIFTLTLHARIIEDKHVFQTQGDENFLARQPMDMFNEKFIDNDLKLVINAMNEYYDEGVEQ